MAGLEGVYCTCVSGVSVLHCVYFVALAVSGGKSVLRVCQTGVEGLLLVLTTNHRGTARVPPLRGAIIRHIHYGDAFHTAAGHLE